MTMWPEDAPCAICAEPTADRIAVQGSDGGVAPVCSTYCEHTFRERRRSVLFLRDEAARMRARDEGADAAVAAHFEIAADMIDRGEHNRSRQRPPHAVPGKGENDGTR